MESVGVFCIWEEEMKFYHAIEAVLMGKSVGRKGYYVSMWKQDPDFCEDLPFGIGKKSLKTGKTEQCYWSPSQDDMFAGDWELIR